MTATAHDRHLFIAEAGIEAPCEVCGQGYDQEIHKQALGPNSMDLHHLPEDERIEEIAAQVHKGQVVAVLLEMGTGKVERYIRKLAKRHPDVRLINRTWGPGPLVETVQFGPKVNS